MTPPPPPPSGKPEQNKEAQLHVLLEAGLINEDSLNEDHTRTKTIVSATGSSDSPTAAAVDHTNKDKETLRVLLEVGLINEDSLNDDRTRTGTNTSGEGCENLRSPGVPTEREESSSRGGEIADHEDAVVALGGTSKTTPLEDDLKKDLIISEGLTCPSPPTTATATATTTSTTSGSEEEETTTTRSTTTTTISSCSVLRETPGAFAINRQAIQRLEPMGSVRSLNVSIAASEEAEDAHSSSSEELSLPPEEDVLLEDAFVVAEEGRGDNDCHLNSAFHESSGQFTTATDTASAELELIDGHVITTTNTNKGTSTKETQGKHSKATRWILVGLAAIIVIVVVLWATLFRNEDDEEGSIGVVTTEVAPAILEDNQGATNLGIIPPFLTEKDGIPSPIAKAIATIDSPQYHANIWMRNDPNLEAYSMDRQWQRFHMVSFYFMSNGKDWHRNDHWLSYNVSECQWFNHGTSAGVYGLDSLEALDVCTPEPNNELLVFNLSSNNLHGHFELITHWVPTMRRFDISNNQLEGLLPVMSHQPHVEVYDVSNNQFDGLMVGEFSSFGMKVTRTHGNRLFGHAPGIYQFLQHLEHLDNANNLYQNPLVSEIGHCQHLKALNNANNMFYGSLPSELGSLSLLTTYNVSNNMAVNGTIPSEYGLLTKLTTLDLSGTFVTGPIPDSLCERSRNGSLHIWANCSMVECCS